MIVKIKFRGIDDFNRPVYKVYGDKYSSLHFGSVTKLFPWDTMPVVIDKYFNEHIDELEYFGTHFNCEPEGGTFKGLELQII
jgi:hypothetical protein